MITQFVFSMIIAVGPFDNTRPFRLWFSNDGVDENQPINGTPGEYQSPTDGINPIIESSGDAQRLYVWGTLLNTVDLLIVRSIYLDVNLHVLAGDARLTGFHWYNFSDPGPPRYRRWGGTNDGEWSDQQINDARTGSGSGSGLYIGAYQDAQYDPVTNSWLLGTVDFESSSDAQAELFFGVGRGGIFIEGPPAPQAIYFGWGDEPLDGSEIWGAESELPDAIIIPEPATIFLLGAAAALSRFERR
ncbi:MAG: PEP-CTERM sorting domain-containing protein [Phycisphaerales bacterium]|nr:PEP-CTERM sorting domain-containing protein [Phycisphaerales bacterium]